MIQFRSVFYKVYTHFRVQRIVYNECVGGKLYMESPRVEFEVALLTDGWDQTESFLLLFIGYTLAYCWGWNLSYSQRMERRRVDVGKFHTFKNCKRPRSSMETFILISHLHDTSGLINFLRIGYAFFTQKFGQGYAYQSGYVNQGHYSTCQKRHTPNFHFF